MNFKKESEINFEYPLKENIQLLYNIITSVE